MGCNMKPSTGRNDGGNDCHLRVTPNESAIAVRVEYRCRRQEVVDPPHAEGEPGAGNADQCRIHGPALFLNHSGECCNPPDDSLAQCNDGEETVALGNMVGVPRCAPILALSDEGPCEFDG